MAVDAQYQDIADKAIARLRSVAGNRFPGIQSEEIFHDLYEKSVKIYDDLSTHYKYGADPAELIRNNRPNEDISTLEYRLLTFEQVTFAYASKILALQKANIFNAELYSIQFPEERALTADDSIKEYLEKELPEYGSLVSLMRNYFHDFITIDPNGWVAVLPKLFDFEIVDPMRMREPYPTYIPSTHVYDFDEDFLLAKSDRVNRVSENVEYPIFYYFDKNVTLVLVQIDTNADGPVVDPFVVEAHFRGTKKARQFCGIPGGLSDSVLTGVNRAYFLSTVQSTVPHFNLALKQISELQVAITSHLFPKLFEAETKCAACFGTGIDKHRSTCEVCNGLGKIVDSIGPAGAYVVEPNEDGTVNAPAGYIEMNPQIISTAVDWYMSHVREAFRAVNMDDLITDSSGQAISAESRRIKQQQLHAHFRTAAEIDFDVMQWIADEITHSRYRSILNEETLDEYRVYFNAPRHYDTTRPNEATLTIKEATESNAHLYSQIEVHIAANNTLFGIGSVEAELANTALLIDPFALKSTEDILALSVAANIDDFDIELHVRINQLVRHAYLSDKENFLELSLEEKLEVIIALLRSWIEAREQIAQERSAAAQEQEQDIDALASEDEEEVRRSAQSASDETTEEEAEELAEAV